MRLFTAMLLTFCLAYVHSADDSLPVLDLRIEGIAGYFMGYMDPVAGDSLRFDEAPLLAEQSHPTLWFTRPSAPHRAYIPTGVGALEVVGTVTTPEDTIIHRAYRHRSDTVQINITIRHRPEHAQPYQMFIIVSHAGEPVGTAFLTGDVLSE